MPETFILGGARTPQASWARGKKGDGSRGGALKDVDVFDLGAAALKGALAKTGVAHDAVDCVVFGSAYHSHPNNCYGSRYIALRAGLPERVPCWAVNMACATALQSVILAAQMIGDGESHLCAAGGAESTSRIRTDVLFPSFNDLSAGSFIGKTVEDMAVARGITREDADGWALRSHTRALLAQRKGLFAEEIVPVGEAREDDFMLEHPDIGHFRAAKASYEGGIVTGANAHGLVDAASAVLLGDAEGTRRAKEPPLGRLASWAAAAVAPNAMAYATVPAIRSALDKAGWKLEDVDLFEVNETFAAQLLLVQKELAVPSEKLNVNGGAVGMGHPFGATGTRLVITLLKELKRRKARKGVAAICVGGGQGVALALEAL